MRNLLSHRDAASPERRRFAAIGLAAALALGAAACGSDATPLADDGSTVPPTTAPVESPGTETPATEAPTAGADPTAPGATEPTAPVAPEPTQASEPVEPEPTQASEPVEPEPTEFAGQTDREEAAADAALAYLQAVDAGDLATAWDLMAPQSQDALGSQAEFDALGSALAEGLAAYASAPDLDVRVTPVADGIHAVTMSGTVTREGFTELDATAMIVRPSGVSPFEGLSTGDFATFAPATGSELGSGDVIRPTIETGTLVTASINEDVIDLTLYADEADPAAYALPVAPFAPGRVTVTVVLGTPDALTAYAAAYTATA